MDKYFLLVLAHILIIVPTFLYVGFQRAATPDWLYNVLLAVALLIFVYHGAKAVMRWVSNSPVLWVNMIHAMIVAPLIAWIGYHGKKTGRPAYDMLLMIAFAALGFHLQRLVVISQTFVSVPDENGVA